MAGIGQQWLKKTVLQRNLPTKQKEDVKALLSLTQTQAGNNIYYRVKQELLRLYAPKPKDSYNKALTRTMVGLPSQLGNQLVNNVCKKPDKFKDCCCASHVEALWHNQLPINIRAHVSNMTFTRESYKQVFEAADQVFLSSRQVSVAAVSANLDETQAAFNPENQPQVAAISGRGAGRGRGRGGGRGWRGGGRNNRGGRGNGGNGGSQNSQSNSQSNSGSARGPRHASSPPEACCDRHYRHGPEAWFCVAPLTCPWKNKCAARP